MMQTGYFSVKLTLRLFLIHRSFLSSLSAGSDQGSTMDRLISTFILAQTDSQEQADAAIQDIVKGTLCCVCSDKHSL
jgi:hypothetical protein